VSERVYVVPEESGGLPLGEKLNHGSDGRIGPFLTRFRLK
jgi:hypothetical protein